MFRIAGCILVVAGCSVIGFIKASSYKSRTTELRNILELIRLLNMEIVYRKDSLVKVLENVSSAKECWFSKVLRDSGRNIRNRLSLEESWNISIKENEPSCPLQKCDIDILKDLAMGLGKSDTRGQESIIRPAVKRLEASLADAIYQEKSQGKMYRGIGIAAGIVIAVMLI